MNEKEVEEANMVSQEEIEKIEMLRMVMEKVKSISSLEKYKEELAKQTKELYAQKMFYEFLQDIVKKLYSSDTEKLQSITQILNNVSYTNTLRKYMDLFAKVSDFISVDTFDDSLALNFYVKFNDFPIHIARIDISQLDSPGFEIKLGFMFDDSKDILKLKKEELMTYLIRFINNLEDKMKQSCLNECEDP